MMTGSSRSSIDSAIWAAKLVVLSLGIISTLLLVKVVIIPFLLSSVPATWMWITSWLCPPYIHILANFIIISIAFFHHHHIQPEPQLDDDHNHNHHGHGHSCFSPEEFGSSTVSKEFKISQDIPIMVVEGDSSKSASSRAAAELSSPPQQGEEEDTLDGMWKAIMEGKGKAVEKQPLKKSETWKAVEEEVALVVDKREMRKSETYREPRSRESNESQQLLRREMVVPCSEELNKRVEAFIKKINNDMRLQRLESDQRFNDMVNRGL